MAQPTSDDDCAIDNTPHPDPTISEKEMMIRGMSTFLAVTGQQLNSPTRGSEADQDYRTIRRMDRLATLFVCQDKADVVAVTISQAGGGAKVYSIQESGSEEPGGSEELEARLSHLYTIKNSRGNDKKDAGAIHQPFLPPQVLTHSPGKSFGQNWLVPYLKGKS